MILRLTGKGPKQQDLVVRCPLRVSFYKRGSIKSLIFFVLKGLNLHIFKGLAFLLLVLFHAYV